MTIELETLVISNFSMVNHDATPSTIVNPFEVIEISRDYDTISRILHIYFRTALTPNSDYTVTISGLRNPFGQPLAEGEITFTSPADTTQESTDLVPVSIPVEIEDLSIIQVNPPDIINVSVNPDFYVVSVNPATSLSYYLDESYNEGRIEIFFNQTPAANFISGDYFKVQRKTIGRGIARWETLDALVTSDPRINLVVIYLPSTDTVPVYGEPDKVYWETGYKYRVRILGSIGPSMEVS